MLCCAAWRLVLSLRQNTAYPYGLYMYLNSSAPAVSCTRHRPFAASAAYLLLAEHQGYLTSMNQTLGCGRFTAGPSATVLAVTSLPCY